MKKIVRYHIREAGTLYVEMSDGQHRPATVTEELSILSMVPDLAPLLGWQGSPLSGANYLSGPVVGTKHATA